MTRNSEIWRFIFRRLLGTLPLLIGVGVFTFILVRVLPGDPAAYYATGPLATNEEIAQVRTVLGLDRPIAEQLERYFKDIASGDLGRSLVTGQLVSRDLVERFPASFELTLVAMILAWVSLPRSAPAPGSITSFVLSARLACRCPRSSPAFS